MGNPNVTGRRGSTRGELLTLGENLVNRHLDSADERSSLCCRFDELGVPARGVCLPEAAGIAGIGLLDREGGLDQLPCGGCGTGGC